MGKKTSARLGQPVEASPPSPSRPSSGGKTAARAAEAAAKAVEAAAVAADEHARAARRLLDNREYLFNEEVKLAEAEVQPKGGRVLLRYSGTEPKARLLIEGPDMDVMERWTSASCGSIRRQVGQAG